MSISTTPTPASGSSSNSSLISKWLPSNPFELPETRELIAQKVAMGQSSPSSVFVRFGVMVLTLHVVGEITDHDVAVMEKGYRWMIYTPPVRLCPLYSTNHHMFLLTRPLFLRRCCLTYLEMK